MFYKDNNIAKLLNMEDVIVTKSRKSSGRTPCVSGTSPERPRLSAVRQDDKQSA